MQDYCIEEEMDLLGDIRFNIHTRTHLRSQNRSVNFGALQVNQVSLSFPPLALFSNHSLVESLRLSLSLRSPPLGNLLFSKFPNGSRPGAYLPIREVRKYVLKFFRIKKNT